jgi:hypothetical protein
MPATTPSDRESGRAFYVYAVTRAADAALPDDLAGVDPRFPVHFVEHDGLAAIVSEVTLDEFGEETLEENVRRAAWLEEKAVIHDRVVGRALASTALLPMRFGTIFASEDHVRAMLSSERSAFTDLLHHVGGKSEWGVKAFLSPEKARRSVTGSRRDAAALRDEVEGATAGRSYLARKKLDRLVAEEVSRTVAQSAEAAHRRLAAHSSEARANPPQPRELSGRDEEMVLNGAYLIGQDQEESFRRLVAALEAEYSEVGIAFELTGPWPPYNFVPLRSEGRWTTS